jgi:hypothetical protein
MTHKTCQTSSVSREQQPTSVERKDRITAEAAYEKPIDKQIFADMIAQETPEEKRRAT